MKFNDLGLSNDVIRSVSDAGYDTPTPIQEQAIPIVLMGRDILGCAQTGTGKTASFTLPMIDILHSGQAKARMPRSLIIEPTRELAAQVADNFETYGKYHKLSKALLIGGAAMNEQIKVLERGVDVLIATPGRLLDHFERGGLLLRDVKILVIDEADRMLDMGFIPDVERIVSLLPTIRQTLFFSATMPPEIKRLADAFLINPKQITIDRKVSPAETVAQHLVRISHVSRRGEKVSGHREKRAALRNILARENVQNAFIFCNRKRDVGITCRSLVRHKFDAGELHGDMNQQARTETLGRFKRGEFRYLVCSDVAARGIDVSNVSHVFNFDIPTHPEDYIHRIGRTGRAGKTGQAYSLAIADEQKYIDAIETLLGAKIPVTEFEAPQKGKERQPSRQTTAAKPPKEDPSKTKQQPAQKKAKTATQRPSSDHPVLGLGDHMPAFLSRPVKLD